VKNIEKEEPSELLVLAKQKRETTRVDKVDEATGNAFEISDGKSLKNDADRPYFKMVQRGEPVGHSVIMGKTQQKPLLCFSVPILNEAQFSGAVTQCAGLDDISTQVSNLKIGESGFAFLVDENAKVIASGRPASVIDSELVDLSDDAVLTNSIENEITRLSLGEMDVVSYKQRIGLNWTLVIQQDYDEAFADIIALKREAWTTIGLTLLISILVVLILSRFISKPLQSARDETDNILRSTRDGLFIIDQQFTIGSQISSNLPSILKIENPGGANFIDYLTRNIPLNISTLAKSYIDLLFTDRIKEQLIERQNPLSEVKVSMQDAQGFLEVSYLNFIFKRVYDDKKEIIGLLVTVRDETKNIELKNQIELIKEDKAKQISLLSDIIHLDYTQLVEFIETVKISLANVNNVLEQPGSSSDIFQQKISMMYQTMHKIKSDAVSIDFDLFVNVAHKFEDKLSQLKSSPSTTGDAFISLTIELEEFFKLTKMIEELVDKLSSMRNYHVERRSSTAKPAPAEWETVDQLSAALAEKYNKPIELHWKGFNYDMPSMTPDISSTLVDIAKQCMRNAFVHGLESPTTRKNLTKLPQGQITMTVRELSFGIAFTFQDDGQGIDYGKMKQLLVKTNQFTLQDATALTEEQLNQLLLTTDISTADVTTVDAGRGVGMQFVYEQVKALGGRIQLKTIAGKGTVFIIKIPHQRKIAA